MRWLGRFGIANEPNLNAKYLDVRNAFIACSSSPTRMAIELFTPCSATILQKIASNDSNLQKALQK